jgi:dipeptidyl aminopeptidase/acylaminoacyl peptidase
MNRKAAVLVVSWLVVVLAIAGELATAQVENNGRAMTPEDLLATQAIQETVMSPDGKWVAFVIDRPRKVGEAYERGYLGGLERSDLWLASTDGKMLTNLTRGESQHAGYWNPVWSPDSRRLALVSTRDGDNVRAYVYDLNTQHLRMCTNDGVDLGMRIETPDNNAWTTAWLSPNELVIGVLPPGARPLAMDENERTLRISAKAMADVKRGRGVTASILDTEGIDVSSTKQKHVTLSLFDVTTNRTRVLTRIPLLETRLSQRVVSVSSDRSYAAILATDYPNTAAHGKTPTTEDIAPLRVGFVNLKKTKQGLSWLQSVRPASFGLGVRPTSIRWAPSGSTFAFIGMTAKDVAPAVLTVDAAQEKPEAVAALKYEDKAGDTHLLTAEDTQWASSGELLVYGYAGTRAVLQAEASLKDVRGFSRDNSKETVRRDWWVITSPNSFHNLTRDIPQSPRALLKTRKSKVLFAASGGRLWSIDVSSRSARALTVAGSIVWPRVADANRVTDSLIVATSSSDLFRVDVQVGSAVKLATIPPGAVVTEYAAARQVIIYQTPITEVCAIANHTEPVTLVSLNRQLDAIAKPEYRTIQYRTSDGKQVSGALLLPYGYFPGRRYPLLVHLYAGVVAPSGDWANPYKFAGRYDPDPLVLAGRGYAVLIPTVPLPPMGVQSDPMLELDKAVRPAVDKVVEIGIADADRTGLIGFSYGGYCVYSLVTQTTSFKAAVAVAGVNNMLSVYGRLDPRHRFSEVQNPLFGPFLVEAQQMRMGVPPWQDLQQYVRNSPYLHADRVMTPLLMIHGELDSLPLTEPEQFFVALNRLGKRAKLVRYLAEGHAIESPGNVLDMYGHIFKWFDEFLLNRQPNQSSRTK